MRERRGARVGTVSGLALLTGGTAVAAVAHGASSVFATVMLGMLAAGLGHALLTEIRRQARRGTGRWATADTINTVLLTAWAAGAAILAALPRTPLPVRAVGLILTFGYALSSAYFVLERRRTIVAAKHGTAGATEAAGTESFEPASLSEREPTTQSQEPVQSPVEPVN
ncbi:hypothetical protein AB0J80_26310 [Actinoplanes sp. NPDC049548]|uniref:hypothetical protein n=1 Tax=Actinoplanes sp. NPDC049548 TaxID=3155152 RepID=UPI0034202CA6